MTPQESRTTAVEIIDANNVVVGTVTTLPDGSFACPVTLALGEQSFTARASDKLSNKYTLSRKPIEPTHENFEELPLIRIYPDTPLLSSSSGTLFSVMEGTLAFINNDGQGNQLSRQYLRLSLGTVQVTPRTPCNKFMFTRAPKLNGTKVTYYDDRHFLLGELSPMTEGNIVIESERPIYKIEFTKPAGSQPLDEGIDKFTFE